MNADQFWAIIDDVKRSSKGNQEQFAELLWAKLAKVHIDEVLEFTRRFDEATAAANTARLWGAAYIINGGRSDDGFYYFRAWLVAQGRLVFEAARANPDSLAATLKEEDVEFEELLYLPSEVYQARTGQNDFYNRVGSRMSTVLQGSLDEWSVGGDIDEAKGRQLYPNLWRKFME